MKTFLKPIVCGGMLAALLCTPALAAEPQGDFDLLVNGDAVTFTDAAPQLKDNRSFLPMVATFEALGFPEEDMTWDGAARTVTATKDNVTVSLTIGENKITVTREADATASSGTVTTDVAPYIDASTSRTYIPVGLVADALGYRVGWDEDTYTVIIDDVDAILAANTETYDLMDRYMAYAQKYNEGNYRVTGSYDAASSSSSSGSYEDTEGNVIQVDVDMDQTIAGDYTMLVNQTAFQFDTDMEMGGTLSGQPIAPTTIDMDLRGDLDTGKLYFQSVALSQMLGAEDTDAWYSLDMKGLLDEVMPGYYDDLMALSKAGSGMTFTQALEEVLKSDAVPLTSASTTSDYLTALNLLVGDSNFQKSGNTYTSVISVDGTSMSFILYTNGDVVTGYGMEMSSTDPTLGMDLSMAITMQDDEMTMTMEMTTDEPESSMTMTMDGLYESTDTSPTAEPPAGSSVVDVMDLLNSLLTSDSSEL